MPALRIKNLCKTYKNGTKALCGVNIEVPEGEFFALLGPNGAGKTTLIGIITSLVTKSSGQVEVFGIDLDRDPAGVKSKIGLVPQEINFNLFERVIDIVINQAGYYGVPRNLAHKRTEKIFRSLDLWQYRRQNARELSGGFKRRLMIARALIHDPPLLILDEPTAGVDIELRRSMWTYLRHLNRLGKTIILSTHYLEEAENLCRQIAIIHHGKLAEYGSMRKLLKNLQKETFVFDLLRPLAQAPDLPGCPAHLTDPNTLEVEIDHEHGINAVFARLNAAGIEILSMRTKTNRLEEVFMNLIRKQPDAH